MKEIDLTELLRQIGFNLHAIRTSLKQTLQGVASHVGITHPVLSQVENGRYKTLQLSLLIKLCNHYGISIQQVLSLELSNVFQINGNTNSITHQHSRQEMTQGFELCLQQANKEIDFLKRQIDKLTDGLNKK